MYILFFLLLLAALRTWFINGCQVNTTYDRQERRTRHTEACARGETHTRVPAPENKEKFTKVIISMVYDTLVTNQGFANFDLSYDGSWMTRGHKSHLGIGFVIEADTRVVVDFALPVQLTRPRLLK